MIRCTSPVFAVGATGRASGLTICELARWGIDVRALVEDPAHAYDTKAMGAKEVVLGNLRDAATIETALVGVDAVFFAGPLLRSDEVELGVGFVEIARKAGVRKFVYSGISHPTRKNLSTSSMDHSIQAALFRSGMICTVLQSASFFQNIGLVWQSVLKEGVLPLAYPVDAPVARIDYRDVAEVVAIALADNRLDYGSFELSSNDAPTGNDVATVMSQVLRREITAVEIGLDEWVAAAGLRCDEHQATLIKHEFDPHSACGSHGNAFVLKAILGREPRATTNYIRDLATRRFTTAFGAH